MLKKAVIRLGKIFFYSAKHHIADQNSQRAVALTYYTVFSLVPIAALLFGIAKGFDMDQLLRAFLVERLWQHRTLLEQVCSFADTTLREAQGGVVAGAGIVILLWTVMWLASNVEKSFNAVWHLPSRQNLFRKINDYLALLILTPVALVLLSSAGVFLQKWFGDLLLRTEVFGLKTEALISLLSIGMAVLFTSAVFIVLYLSVPNTRVRFSAALLAGFVAGILFLGFQHGFILLQSWIFRYNRIYGSFAILPLFLIWLQWSWQVVLFGAEVGFVSQNLDTGLFDDNNGVPDSLRLLRFQQLTIAKIIYRNVAVGSGATSREELTQRLQLSAIELKRDLETLESAGVIAATNTESMSFLPTRSPSEFTIVDCCRQLDECGGNAPSHALCAEGTVVRSAIAAIEQNASSSKDNRLLSEC